MTIGVAIFSKTIGLSPVKTRLAADIGTMLAEQFFRLSISCVHTTVTKALENSGTQLYPYWFLAEEEGASHFHIRDFPLCWTGEGDLGTRLASVSAQLFEKHDGIIFLGTDSPQLSWKRIIEAVDIMMQNPDAGVAGPAVDGGFYLFGSMFPIPRNVWESVTYSNSGTLQDLIHRLHGIERDVKNLHEEQDVDVLSDLKSLSHKLKGHQSELNAEQVQLLDWLTANSDLF